MPDSIYDDPEPEGNAGKPKKPSNKDDEVSKILAMLSRSKETESEAQKPAETLAQPDAPEDSKIGGSFKKESPDAKKTGELLAEFRKNISGEEMKTAGEKKDPASLFEEKEHDEKPAVQETPAEKKISDLESFLDGKLKESPLKKVSAEEKNNAVEKETSPPEPAQEKKKSGPSAEKETEPPAEKHGEKKKGGSAEEKPEPSIASEYFGDKKTGDEEYEKPKENDAQLAKEILDSRQEEKIPRRKGESRFLNLVVTLLIIAGIIMLIAVGVYFFGG